MTKKEEFAADSERFNELVSQGMLPSIALRKLESEKNIAAQTESERERLERESVRQKQKEEELQKKEDEKRKKEEAQIEEKRKKEEFKYKGKSYLDQPADFKDAVKRDIETVGGQFLGEGVGLLGALFGIEYIGIKLENSIVKESTIITEFEKWIINNSPKLLIYYLTRRYTRYMEQGLQTGILNGIGKAMPASIVLDTFYRVTKKRLIGDQQWVPLTVQQL